MIWQIVGVLLVGALIGLWIAPRLRRIRLQAWRPGAAMLSLALIVAAAAAALVKHPIAVLLALVGVFVAMGARRSARQASERASSEGPRRRRGGMSQEEARDILGVAPEATAEEVQAAYLRLIRRAHPDQGGSSGLAAQLNAARDVLLGKK